MTCLHGIFAFTNRRSEVPHKWNDAVTNVQYKKINMPECRNYHGISLVAPAGRVLLKVVA